MKIIPDHEINQEWARLGKRFPASEGLIKARKLVRWVEARLSARTGKRVELSGSDHSLGCHSLFSANDHKPYIGLEVDGKLLVQIPPETARAYAYNLITAAEAAEQDALLLEFIQREVGVPLEQGAGILVAFRKYREEK
jgi:hypothetical protein